MCFCVLQCCQELLVFFISAVLEIELRDLDMLGEFSTTAYEVCLYVQTFSVPFGNNVC